MQKVVEMHSTLECCHYYNCTSMVSPCLATSADKVALIFDIVARQYSRSCKTMDMGQCVSGVPVNLPAFTGMYYSAWRLRKPDVQGFMQHHSSQ